MVTVRERPRSGSIPRHEQVVDNQLNKALQRIRVLDLSTGIFSFLAITLAFSLVMALLDRWLNLPLLARQLALLVYGATVATFVGLFLIRPYLRKINPYYAARQVEKTLPSAKNSVVNWLDLRDEPIAPAILGAVGQRAAQDLAHTDLEEAISGKRAAWLGSLTGILLLAQFMALIFWGVPTFTSLWGRTFAPFNNLGITSKTRIEVKTKDVTVPVDHSVTISASVEGKVPDSNRADALKLHIRYRQGDPYEEAILLEPESEREWFATVPVTRVQSGFWYKVTGGDYETPEYHVLVRSLPMITGFDVSLLYRPYLGWVDKTGHNANLRDVAGTQAAMVVHTNRAVSKGALVFSSADKGSKQIYSTPVKDDSKAMRFAFVLETSGVYRIQYTSTDGESSAESPDYTVTVIPDNAPKVEINQPGADVSLPAVGTLQLGGSASDDFGIKRITLLMKLGEDKELEEKPYRNGVYFKLGESGGYPQMLEYKDFIELPKLKSKLGQVVTLAPGMVIEYWLEAEDACDFPESHKVQSKHFKITIAEPDQDKKKEQEEQQKVADQAKKDQKEHDRNQDQKLNQEKQQLEQNNQQERDKTKADQQNKNQDKDQADKGEGDKENSKEGNQGDKDKSKQGGQGDKNKDQTNDDDAAKDGSPKDPSKDPNQTANPNQKDEGKGDDKNPNDAKQPDKNKKKENKKDKDPEKSKANDQKDKNDNPNGQKDQGGSDNADTRKDSQDKANKIDNNNPPGTRNVKADDAQEKPGNEGQQGNNDQGSEGNSNSKSSDKQANNLAKHGKDLQDKINNREQQKGNAKNDPADAKAENKGPGQPQSAPDKGEAKDKNQPPENGKGDRDSAQAKNEGNPNSPDAQNKGDSKEESNAQQADQKPGESKDKAPGQQSAGDPKGLDKDQNQQAAKNAEAKDEGKPPQAGKQDPSEGQAKNEGKAGNPGDKNAGEKTQAKEAGKGDSQDKAADGKAKPDGKEPAATAKNDAKPDSQPGQGEGEGKDKGKQEGKDQNVAKEKNQGSSTSAEENKKASQGKNEGKKDQGDGAKASAKAEKPPQEKGDNKEAKGGVEAVADKKNAEPSKENGGKDAGQEKTAPKDKGESTASAKGEQPGQKEKGDKNKGDGSAKDAKPEDVKDLAKHMQGSDQDKKEAAERKLNDIAKNAKDEQARKDAEKALKEGNKEGKGEKSDVADNKPMKDGQSKDKGEGKTGEAKKGEGQKDQDTAQAKNNADGNKEKGDQLEGDSKNEGKTAKGKDPGKDADPMATESDPDPASIKNHPPKKGGASTGGPSTGDPDKSAPSTNREDQPGSAADPEFANKANDLQLRKMRDALDKKLLDGSMTDEEKAAYKDWLKKLEEFKRNQVDEASDADQKAPNPGAKQVNEGATKFKPGVTDKASNPKNAGNGSAPPEFQGSFIRATKTTAPKGEKK